jgi:hypothetical protein
MDTNSGCAAKEKTMLEHANKLETVRRLLATVKGQLADKGELTAKGTAGLQQSIAILCEMQRELRLASY